MNPEPETGALSPPVTIDARVYDAVIFGLDGVVIDTGAAQQLSSGSPDEVAAFGSTVAVVRKLQSIGVGAAIVSPAPDCGETLRAAGLDDLFAVVVDAGAVAPERLTDRPGAAILAEAVRRLGVPVERIAVVDSTAAGVAAGRNSGLALVVGVDRVGGADDLLAAGADAVVGDLADVAVPTDFRPVSALRNAVESYGQMIGITRFRRLMVFVDFDGTLSPITSDPDTAALVDGADQALKHLAELCPVVVLSDRDLDDLRNRVGLSGIWYAASHGFEIVAPDGTCHTNEAAVAAIPAIDRVAAQLHATLAAVPEVSLEHKRFAVAVHYRNVPADRIGEVIASVHRLGRWEGLTVVSGRKRIELRPDVEWDTGATVGWIREKVDGRGGIVPVYVGDDLTDEAGFDAVRLDGIGIVLRHGEFGDRRTAANVVLETPEEVCAAIRRGANWLAYQKQASSSAWDLTYDGYVPHDEKLREALCVVGNGYFATRGAAPESAAGRVHYPGTYVAGVYNRLADDISGTRVENESIVNLPNWLPLTFRVDGGEWFDIDAVTILAYRQTLDLRHAVLTRAVRFRDAAGRTTVLTQDRFAAMHHPHVGALKTSIVAEDWSGRLEIRSVIDGGVRNANVERYRDLSSRHLESVQIRELTENSAVLSARTSQSAIPVAVAVRTMVWRNDTGVAANYQFVDEDDCAGHRIALDVQAGDKVTAEKVAAIFTGRDVAISEPAIDAASWVSRLGRFAELRAGHEIAWTQIWERMAIELAGHEEDLKVLRLHLLHLLQTVSPNSAELDAGVPARGLHGEAYRGLIFWDELFIFPVLNFRFPMITRALLRYRYRRLPEARHEAKQGGYAGAMFPWQSGTSGREECQRMHLNPRSGRWVKDASALAHHIGLAVGYNVWQFYQATGDLAFLIDYGAEMLIEIARFWVSRAEYDAERDRYVIRGVIGPDEFHSGYPDAPHDGVDNNAYTNVLAVWVILRALETLESLPTPNRIDVMEKLRLQRSELARWRTVTRRMFVPFHDGMISQFEGYEKLADLDWDAYRKRYGDIHRLDRLLEAEDDDINRYKASKQADVLMLLYLFSANELIGVLQHLGYRLDPDRIPAMVDYYIARTSHGSTLSAAVHSWVLARAHRDRAIDYFHHVLSSDVDDIQGGTTSEGIHLAAMAGSVDLVQRCFTGLEFRGDRVVLSPNWPEHLGALGFPIHYRGMHLHLRVSGRGAEISVDPRDAALIEIECHGRVKLLKPGSIIRFG